MIAALLRSIAVLAAPPMRRVVALSLGLAILAFAVLWLAVAAALYHAALFDWRPLNWLVDLLGGLARAGDELAALPGGRDDDHGLLPRTGRRRGRSARLPVARRRPPAADSSRLLAVMLRLTGLTLAPQSSGASGLSAGPRDKSLSLSRAQRISFGAGVFRSGRAQTARCGGSQEGAQPVRRPHFSGRGGDCRAVRPAFRQSRRAGRCHGLHVAHLRGAAAP